MNKWLQNFAYHIDLKWEVFVVAGVIVLIITIITTGYKAYVPSVKNPVDALRYE